MPIRVTRRLLSAVLDGTLNKMHFHIEGSFGLAVPSSAPGVESDLLNPIKTWASKEDYEATAKKLVEMFRANFVKFEPHVDTDVKDAALHGAGGA
jgi:phosphoenolpyruvate carboxykinase (ATP)